MIQDTYCLDTVFVVDTRRDYLTDNTNTVDCSAEYRTLTLDRLPAHQNFTFYRGMTCSGNGNQANALFSFTPVRLYSGLDNQQNFARCALDVDAVNKAVGRDVFTHANLRNINTTALSAQEIRRVWTEISRQVKEQGFVRGVSFDWPRQ